MTFKDEETSVESGQVVELYEFIQGAETNRYTSSIDSYVFNSQTWLPRQISRNSAVQTVEERKSALEITLPSEDPVASRYVGIVPGELMTLTITRVHRGFPSGGFVIWSGRITGASFKKSGAECTLQGLTTEAAFSRPIPRFKYLSLCNHILYDGGCTLIASAHQYTGTVVAVSGSIITVSGLLAAESAEWAQSGYVQFGTDFRLVLTQPDDDCTLLLPFREDVLGESVDVFAGCDHTLTICNSKFANKDNYGGFPYVPSKNPFLTRL